MVFPATHFQKERVLDHGVADCASHHNGSLRLPSLPNQRFDVQLGDGARFTRVPQRLGSRAKLGSLSRVPLRLFASRSASAIERREHLANDLPSSPADYLQARS